VRKKTKQYAMTQQRAIAALTFGYEHQTYDTFDAYQQAAREYKQCLELNRQKAGQFFCAKPVFKPKNKTETRLAELSMHISALEKHVEQRDQIIARLEQMLQNCLAQAGASR
jgi:hypothetical protein